MKDYIEQRVLEIAQYIIDTKATVRQAAKEFKISKSSVHKDMSERLPQISKTMAREVKKILEINKAERHIRGGHATFMKYQNGFRKKTARQASLTK